MNPVKHKLDVVKKTAIDIKSKIDDILERDEKLEIATTDSDAYAKDLYSLMEEMAEASGPALRKMGLNREAITHDIKQFVEILEDNEHKRYFASVNIDAKYNKNKYGLANLSNWFERLINSIEKIEGFLETETEEEELNTAFAKIDGTSLSEKEKEEIKEEFLKALNRLNKSCK
jgi:hypothetical protein